MWKFNPAKSKGTKVNRTITKESFFGYYRKNSVQHVQRALGKVLSDFLSSETIGEGKILEKAAGKGTLIVYNTLSVLCKEVELSDRNR